MKRTHTYFSIVLLLSLMIFACGEPAANASGESDTEVSTDLINNPNSASGNEVDPENAAAITFEEEVYEFGQVTQGEKVQHSFVFKNTGKSDLIISSAAGSCGCTVPSWPKEPIAPGEEGKVDVVFDSNGKQGMQHKTVTLVANTLPNKTIVALKGEVLVPENTSK